MSTGFAKGRYGASPDDGLTLVDCRITNAVRCVPPENKPTPAEIGTCRLFLSETISEMPRLNAILALGRIAHDSVLTVFAARKALYPFGHGRVHALSESVRLHDSYHCSRYNTNTGVLTEAMFRKVFDSLREQLGS